MARMICFDFCAVNSFANAVTCFVSMATGSKAAGAASSRAAMKAMNWAVALTTNDACNGLVI